MLHSVSSLSLSLSLCLSPSIMHMHMYNYVFAAELELVDRVNDLARKNDVHRSYIGMGYYDCITPAVIKRNVLENPGW